MPEELFKQFKGGKLADKLNFNFQKVLENICHAGQPLTETNSPNGRIITYPLPVKVKPLFNDFQLVPLNATDIRIVFGTVQDETIGGTNWTPSGMSPGDNPIYSFTPSDSGYAWLDITYDTTAPFNITSVSLNNGDTVPDNTFGESFVTLGSFSVTDAILSGVQGSGIGSQGYQFCGVDSSGTAQFAPV